MEYSRFIIGIDLGTTNIAVTFVDTEDENRDIRTFKITQITQQGEVSSPELLPSFCFFPDFKLIPKDSTKLPWCNEELHTVGSFARDYGSSMPNRFISSAKSWLCHAGVDRKKDILPWGCTNDGIAVSPLKVTSFYLEHIKKAWDYKFAKVKDAYGNRCSLEEQQVVITVPASFDETARELTIEAAEKAGYKNISLLEEPLAAFYSWLDYKGDYWSENISAGDKVLVMDVGGGTCDFSLIEMNEDGVLSRTSAGNHLLLGGDNIDIALARSVESKWSKKLSHGEWLTLCQKTREAKEKLLSGEEEKADVVLLSQGSSVIAGSRRCEITIDEIVNLLETGFIPGISVDSPPAEVKKGLKQMGLPYVSDPSLSKHLLDFLRYSYKVSKMITQDSDDNSNGVLAPTKVLFNGGTMIPKLIRRSIMSNLNSWFPGSDILELDSKNLSLAVSYGAAYYGRTKRGEGVRVKSGTALSYYLSIKDKDDISQSKFVCVMPRGVDENVEKVADRLFALDANIKVQFPLYSSAVRLGDREGDVITDDLDELSFVSTLETLLKYGNQSSRKVKAKIHTKLTETGLLKISLCSLESSHVWPLNFDTRLIAEHIEDSSSDINNSVVINTESTEKACDFIAEYFSDKTFPKVNIYKELEKILDLKKKDWPLQCLRLFADKLLQVKYESLKKPQLEAKWLNLTGYCMRPGFGDVEDIIRMKNIWSMWYRGANNNSDNAVLSEWWVFWRRLVSGLKNGHQRTIQQVLNKKLYPKNIYQKHLKEGVQVKSEMWRCLGALELINVHQKQEAGKILIGNINKLESAEYWALARLGNRHLFHAPVNNIIPSSVVEKWVEKLIKTRNNPKLIKEKLFAVSLMSRKTDSRALNLKQSVIDDTVKFLKDNHGLNSWINHLREYTLDTINEKAEISGDSIPLGLTLED